jgi:hypothetical protein
MILVDKTTEQPLKKGFKYKTFDGEQMLLVGGTPPHKESSTGFVTVALVVDPEDESMDIREYYAGVLNAKWIFDPALVSN